MNLLAVFESHFGFNFGSQIPDDCLFVLGLGLERGCTLFPLPDGATGEGGRQLVICPTDLNCRSPLRPLDPTALQQRKVVRAARVVDLEMWPKGGHYMLTAHTLSSKSQTTMGWNQ